MKTPLDRTKELLGWLGVEVSDLEALRTLPTDQALTLLESLKDKVRKRWKRAAFELHPDRTNGDPERTALFRDLSTVRDRFEAMTLPAPMRSAPVSSYVATNAPPVPGAVFSSVRTAPRKPNPAPRGNVGRVAAGMKP